MENQELQSFLQLPEYQFIHTNPLLKNNIMFLTLGGSHAYGTNVEGSDVDIRGCAFNTKSSLIGTSHFEQVQDNTTDTTIYAFNKLVSLCTACNPNTIELLGCRPEHYLMVHPIGLEFLNNRKMFLSKRAIHSFGGYANQQLRRLENALCRDTYEQKRQEEHIAASCMFAMSSFANKYSSFEDGAIRLYVDRSDKSDMDTEIFMDVTLSHYPLRDYKSIWSEFNNIVKDYGKLNGRNKKKDDAHLNKHAMHLVRLYLMCFDILEKEEIITYRTNDIPELLAIRNGKYQKSDGTFRDEFFEMVDTYEKRMQYDARNTCLPGKPNSKRIEEWVISVNERVIKNEI